MTYKIGDIFESADGTMPQEALALCDNGASIEEMEPNKDGVRRFQIVAVSEPTDEELQACVRAKRNAMLDATDKYVSVPDYPIDESTRNRYIEYRQYLRDYTKTENWWLSEPLDFDAWGA